MSYIGTTEIGKMFLGDVEIDKAYLGDDLVFSSGPPAPVQYTLTVYPSSYDTENSVYRSWATGNYGPSSGYTSATSTSQARFYLVRGSRAETFLYWKFSLDSIPDGATINTVTLSAKAAKSGNSNQVATVYLVVCDGTTEKGEHSAITSTSAGTFTLDTGSGWTGTNIKNLSLLFYNKRGTSNYNTDYYGVFYGATLTITYTV